MAENWNKLPLIHGYLGRCALKIGMALSWKSLHEQRTLPEMILYEHNSPFHPQMQARTLSKQRI